MKANRDAWVVWVLAGVLTLGAATTPLAQDDNSSRAEAMTYFTRGVMLLEEGHPDQAITPLNEAWKLSNHDPTIGERLAQAYYATRDVSRADMIAGLVLEKDPASLEMLHMKARLCLARGDTRSAILFLERARSSNPPSIETERMLATLYAENGDNEQAIDAIARCIRLEPDIPELHTAHGELLLASGRNEEAEAAFKSALEIEPADAAAVENLVNLYQAQQRKAEALAVLETYVATPGATPAARLRLAQAYADAGRAPDAIKLLETARKQNESSEEADLLLGRIYFEAKRYADAKRIFLGLYKKSHASPELARILGDLNLKTGDAVEARKYFDRAIALNPDDYRSYLALFFAQSERFTRDTARVTLTPREAADMLAKASAKAPRGDVDAQFSLGMAYSSVDSLEEARVHLARASEMEPERQDVLFNLASIYEKMNRYDDAERVLKDLLELAPDDPAVCNFYGYLLAVMKKDLDKAERLVKHALEKEPDNAYYIDSLGWVYFQRGDYKRAVTELERAVKLVPEDAVMLEHLGDAYNELSRYKDALSVYQHSSRLQESNSKLREKIQSVQRRLQ